MGYAQGDEAVFRNPGPFLRGRIVQPDISPVFLQDMGERLQQVGQVPTRAGALTQKACAINSDNHYRALFLESRA